MRKNKKKENFDNVVIKNVELTPTTIGKIESNEGNIWAVLALFISLIVIIFVLPYIVNLIQDFNNKETNPPIVIDDNDKDNDNEEDPGDKEEEIDYIPIEGATSKTIKGYRYDIEIDNDSNNLNVKITNTSGSITNLIDTPMYIELYNEKKTLVDRILLKKEEIVTDATKVYNYNFNNQNDENIVYITIDTKSINDYPAIVIDNVDINNNPFLTCIKDNETLVYNFKEDETGYYLFEINDRYSVNENDEDTIATYETLSTSYNSIEGVEADITPKSKGFTFEAVIYLDTVKISEKKKILNNPAFYEKNTLAKTIYFELNSSGYKCN